MDAGAKFVMLAPILPMVVFGVLFFKPPWTPMRVTGFAIFVVSFALLTWARATLGNSFSVTPQAKALVTAGIYSKVRHPVYLFGALMLSGLFLYINMPWLLLILSVIVPLQIVRARTEEKVLVGKFGDQYLDYKKQTWM